MLRTTSRSLTRNVLRSARQPRPPRLSVQPSRQASSGGNGGGGGGAKVLFGGVALVSLAAGGTLGYAATDPEFRIYVEESLPYAKDVFDAILGDPEAAVGDKSVPASKLKMPKELPTWTMSGLHSYSRPY